MKDSQNNNDVRIKLNEEYNQALKIFFTQDEYARKKIENLDPKIAEALGMDHEKSKEIELKKLFIERAESMNLDPRVLTIQIISNSNEEKEQRMNQYHKSNAEVMGITWNEYKKLNPHIK